MAPGARSGGFTYIGLVVLLAILGLVAAAGMKTGSLMQRAAAEEELLEIGAAFSEALRSYAAATPPGKPQQPPTLQDLLRDPRFPNVRRHLRKIFVDPVTGRPEWGVIYLGDKVGVVAVHSLSDRKPLKIANFDLRFSNMENRERISDWKFVMAGGQAGVGGVITPPNSMTGNDTPGAPSLFAPGAGGVTAGGKPGSVQGNAGPKDAGQPPAAPVPAAPVPVEAAPVEEMAPEEPPAPPPEDEDKDKDKEEDKDAGREEGKEEVRAEEKDGRARDEEGDPVQPATPVLPPPVPRRR